MMATLIQKDWRLARVIVVAGGLLSTMPYAFQVVNTRYLHPEGMVPATKSRFEMLLGPKEHEMHHRGQLMLIQRLIGITPHLTRQMQERMAAAQATRA